MRLPSPSPVPVLVNALHAKSGGGVTYLRAMLPLLAAREDVRLHLLLTDSQVPLFAPIDDRIVLHRVRIGGGLLRLLVWEQAVLPVLARRLGCRVTFSPANFGPVLAPRPVIMLRNALAVGAEETRFGKRLYWLVLSAMTAASLATCRRAIAVSEYARRTLTFGLRWFARRTRVVPHGRSARFHPDPPGTPRGSFLLVVADLYVQKNLHGLLQALVLIRARQPETTLLIAGREVDSEYAARLRRLVATLGLQEAVTFLGSVDADRLRSLYASCGVFVFPSTVETFGNPLIEAMACGAPIASSHTTAMPEVLGDAGLTFDPADPADMAAAVLAVLEDPARAAALSARALARAAAFSWERTAAATAAVLHEAAR